MKHSPIVLSIVLVIFATGCGQEKKTQQDVPFVLRKYKTWKLSMSEIPICYTVDGETQAVRSVNLCAEVSGKIIERPVEMGEQIAANQLLYRIEDTFLKIEREQLEASLAASESRLAQARLDLLREERLKYGKVPHRQEMKSFEYQIAGDNCAICRKKLELLDERLERTKLKAPFAGEVTELSRQIGELAQAGRPLVSLIDLDEMKITVQVPANVLCQLTLQSPVFIEIKDLQRPLFTLDEKYRQSLDNGKLPEGLLKNFHDKDLSLSGATVTVESDRSWLIGDKNCERYFLKIEENKLSVYLRMRFKGHIFRFSSQADSLTKKFPIELRMSNPNHQIKVGMLARVSFLLENRPVLLVPRTYVKTAYEMHFVMVAHTPDEAFEERRVEVEPWKGRLIIRSGIQAGEYLREP